MDYDQDELIRFIRHRLDENYRLAIMLGAEEALNVQAAADQLSRLVEAVNSVVTHIQYLENQPGIPDGWLHGAPYNPLSIPILKKIANNWSYHKDFNPDWAPKR